MAAVEMPPCAVWGCDEPADWLVVYTDGDDDYSSNLLCAWHRDEFGEGIYRRMLDTVSLQGAENRSMET